MRSSLFIRLAMMWFCMSLAGMARTQATSAPPQPGTGPLASLDFLLGTWEAKAEARAGSAGAAVSGTYTFQQDVGGHALQRVSSADKCSGPQTFDCQHHDLLTIFADPSAASGPHHSTLFALYIDNEGHVIYYTVAMPDPQTAVFSSEGPAAGPHFRLTYTLREGVMTGRFEGAAPGSDTYNPYLVWSGRKR